MIRTGRRDDLATFLAARGIANTVHYPTALPLHACYAGYGHEAVDFPVAVALSQTALSIPIYAEMTAAQVAYVCRAIETFFTE